MQKLYGEYRQLIRNTLDVFPMDYHCLNLPPSSKTLLALSAREEGRLTGLIEMYRQAFFKTLQ
jgi:hypothetical protein